MNSSTQDWRVECKPSGRDGYVFYYEGSQELPFYWEYGGGNVVVIARFDEPDKFAVRYPWAAGRRREILERLAQELIRQQAPSCTAEIDEHGLCICIKEKVDA